MGLPIQVRMFRSHGYAKWIELFGLSPLQAVEYDLQRCRSGVPRPLQEEKQNLQRSRSGSRTAPTSFEWNNKLRLFRMNLAIFHFDVSSLSESSLGRFIPAALNLLSPSVGPDQYHTDGYHR